MNHFWLIIWLILLFSQMVAAWISQQFMGEVEFPPADLDPFLLQLAHETNRAWPATGVSGMERKDAAPVSRNESLTTRESLILELALLEDKMIAHGVELEIVEDLQAFIGTLDGSESVITINAYIAGIIDWIRPHFDNSRECHLERLSLFPATALEFPVLAFEMSGAPEAMGERLLACAHENSTWNLEELDLLLDGPEEGCWLRGSYTYSNSRDTDAL